jgi:hypothetical protein
MYDVASLVENTFYECRSRVKGRPLAPPGSNFGRIAIPYPPLHFAPFYARRSTLLDNSESGPTIFRPFGPYMRGGW